MEKNSKTNSIYRLNLKIEFENAFKYQTSNMTKVNLIGLIGRKNSGKDSVANIISDVTPVDIKVLRFAFADRLKKVCTELFAFPDDSFFHDQSKKEVVHPDYSHMTPREIMQWFGTDFIRKEMGDEFWINRLRIEMSKEIEKYCQTYANITILVTDVRFKNEAAFLEDFVQGVAGWETLMIYVEADDRLPPMEPDAHISESGIYDVRDSCKHIIHIDNNADYPSLKLEVPARLGLKN